MAESLHYLRIANQKNLFCPTQSHDRQLESNVWTYRFKITISALFTNKKFIIPPIFYRDVP